MMQKQQKITSISEALTKYAQRFQAPQKTVIEAFCDAVAQSMTYTITARSVSYTPTTRIVVITAPSPVKQEIKLREPEILALLREKLGAKNTPVKIL